MEEATRMIDGARVEIEAPTKEEAAAFLDEIEDTMQDSDLCLMDVITEVDKSWYRDGIAIIPRIHR